MASNFRIFSHRDNCDLHLKLAGDFDGSSALELVNALKAHHGKVKKIFINTHGLSSINPFGLEVFHKNCSISKLSHGIVFTGRYGNTMTPQRGYSL